MYDSYLDVIQLLPRIHRLFMNVIKIDLEELDIHDINNVQSIMLFHIGDTELTMGELTSRGVYIGSNATYNVKKMVGSGYLTQEHSLYDRRVSYVRLTAKGRKLREELAMVHQRRIDLPSQAADLQTATSVLRLLDQFLTDVADPRRRSP